MPRVPFIGRLRLQEYVALFGSFVLIVLESIVRIITLALPDFLVRFFYRISRKLFNSLSSPQGRRSRSKNRSVSSPIAKASCFVELCELYGYYAEEHVVHTGDGYLLGVHRLGWKRGEEDQKVNNGPGSMQKKVVYLHHGLLMNSEVWVCLTEEERCLPFMLVEKGFDVWLGNNRGNKYSKKSVKFSPAQADFWNFSIDQFAFHDIPDTIDYILGTTKQKSLSYIGFSQGTAQAFATLSIHPQLNDKVDVFIALAPAMAPPGLASGIVSSFVKTTPEMLFLLFGRKSILSSTPMWEALLYPAIFCWFIDKSLDFLFGWKTKNIADWQKLAAYPHLFSYTSTKSVVHWFQIIRNGTFQMYDDEVQAPMSLSGGSKYTKVAKFPTRNIKTPIVLVYGGSDSLVDIKLMLRELPKHTESIEISHYEHLDFLWAADVKDQVFPHVLSSLDFYAGSTKSKEARDQRSSLISPQLPSYSETERSTPRKLPNLNTVVDTNENDADSDSDIVERRRVFRAGHSPHPSISQRQPDSSLLATPATRASLPDTGTSLHSASSRPEGWWSSDNGANDSPPPPSAVSLLSNAHLAIADEGKRKGSRVSIESSKSGSSARSGEKHAPGIGIGVGKAAPAQSVVDHANVAGLKEDAKRRGRKK